MTRRAIILQWLDSVHDDSVSRKRRRSTTSIDACAATATHPTPAPTDSTMSMSQTPAKRLRRDSDGCLDQHHVLDLDATPRPTRTRTLTSSSLTSSDRTTSEASRTSSPRKQLARMQLLEDGFDRARFRDVDLPPSLAEVVKTLQQLGRGRGVVPEAHKAMFVAAEAQRTFIDESWFSPTAGTYLSFAQVVALVDKAASCERKMHDEACWNMEVHHPLLAAVLRPEGKSGLVDVLYCPTAKIAAAYAPRKAPSRMVDFCLTINPDQISPGDPDAVAIETHLRLGRRINHTGHETLQRTPIAVSIETKRALIEGDTAQLQMGVWQSSLLRMLMRAEEASSVLRAPEMQPPAAPPEETAAAPTAPATTPSEWLPGIIVQGHEWTFVATCRRNGSSQNKPTLLGSIRIGGTQEPLEVYCLMAAIAYLRTWAETRYWPGFKRCLLNSTGGEYTG